jgi:hypothetical protein
MQNEGAGPALAPSHISNFQVHPDLPLLMCATPKGGKACGLLRLGQVPQRFLEFRQTADVRYDTLQ